MNSELNNNNISQNNSLQGKKSYDRLAIIVNKSLENYMVFSGYPELSLHKSIRYSLMLGGKRLRPILSLAVCELLGNNINQVIPFACALEMIHTYSLIHDDLPAMDDDNYRRGHLTNHKVFGEANAILSGDALLNYAMEIMIQDLLQNYDNVKQKLNAINIIMKSSGLGGMITGQVIDIESENINISENTLNLMHKYKTGAIIEASVLSSAVISNAEPNELSLLKQYAQNIGLAFQIKDDILDVEGNLETMGKSSGSDEAKNKTTFVTFYGLENSKNMLSTLILEAINSISGFGDGGLLLRYIAEKIGIRDN